MGKHLCHFTKTFFYASPLSKTVSLSGYFQRCALISVHYIKECLKTHCHVRRAVSNIFSTIETKKFREPFSPFLPFFHVVFLFLLLGCFVVVVVVVVAVVVVVVAIVVGSDDGGYTPGVNSTNLFTQWECSGRLLSTHPTNPPLGENGVLFSLVQ